MNRRAALLVIALTLAATPALAARPADFLANAQGRVHDGESHLARIANWKDGRNCVSTFDFIVPGKATARWSLDWKEVRTVQITTRRHFITDVEEEVYRRQPGIALYGRQTTSVRLPDGVKVAFDNMEFFLKDPSKMDYAFTGLRAYAAACRKRDVP